MEQDSAIIGVSDACYQTNVVTTSHFYKTKPSSSLTPNTIQELLVDGIASKVCIDPCLGV